MRRMLLLALALLLLPIASLLWSGAGGVEQPADFRFINRGEIKTLDPNRMSWLQDIRIGSALWEGLYVLSSKDLEPELAAADRVDVSDDQLVHTFHLRDGARWSNGDPVVSRDFAFAWRRMLEQPGDYTYLFYYIEGAQAYSEGFAASDSQKPVKFEDVGIEVLDDRTLRVKLKHPVTYFPDVLAFAPFYPLHEPSMRKYARTDEATRRVTYDQGFTKPPDLVT
ncbi:MAG: ABC transporter substrate-binding protein, partial [Tepidisphaeraceae bacterium]